MRAESNAGSEPSDEALMSRFCQGDAAAFDVLFERYSAPISGYLHRLTQNRAVSEDLAQATFLSMVKARGRFRAGARVRPWLYAIATNAARDWRRRSRPEELTEEGKLPSDIAAQEDAPRDVGLERVVQRAIGALPESLRLPLVMHRFEGLSFKEIADALGVSEGAVKLRAHRAYERLRGILAPMKEEL
jgi:RNA polymerase sigma-70 factor (ECF subfamily)